LRRGLPLPWIERERPRSAHIVPHGGPPDPRNRRSRGRISLVLSSPAADIPERWCRASVATGAGSRTRRTYRGANVVVTARSGPSRPRLRAGARASRRLRLRDRTGHLSARPPAGVDCHHSVAQVSQIRRLVAQSPAVPRRSSRSTGSVTRTALGTSRPTGRSSTTTRPSTSTTRSTRCACGLSSRTTSPARTTPAATSSTGTAPSVGGVAGLPRPHLTTVAQGDR
jgi:hypothetical protein